MNRLADYFAVCGLGDSPELLDGRAPEAERARDIMDMAVVFSNDEAPDGFMTVTMTPSGHKANFDQLQYSTPLQSTKSNVYLCYRRRDHGEHGPAIAAVDVVNKSKNEVPPPGFELIEKTPNGKSANLVPSSSRGVYIAVRRQDALAKLVHESRQAARRRLHSPPPGVGTGSSSRKKKDGSGRDGGKSGSGGVGKRNTLTGARDGDGGADDGSGGDEDSDDLNDDDDGAMPGEWAYHLEPAIQDVIVVASGRGESVPDGFLLIDKSLNTRRLAVKMCLAVRRAAPVGLCDLPFKASILDRFPRQDYTEFSLPESMLSMFSFPEGLRLKRASRLDAPQALYFNYVMVDNHGKARLHAANEWSLFSCYPLLDDALQFLTLSSQSAPLTLMDANAENW